MLERLGFAGTSVAKTAKSQARVILFNYWCAPAHSPSAGHGTESCCAPRPRKRTSAGKSDVLLVQKSALLSLTCFKLFTACVLKGHPLYSGVLVSWQSAGTNHQRLPSLWRRVTYCILKARKPRFARLQPPPAEQEAAALAGGRGGNGGDIDGGNGSAAELVSAGV